MLRPGNVLGLLVFSNIKTVLEILEIGSKINVEWRGVPLKSGLTAIRGHFGN